MHVADFDQLALNWWEKNSVSFILYDLLYENLWLQNYLHYKLYYSPWKITFSLKGLSVGVQIKGK